jgi:predicted nucleic acid-binding protein
LRGTECSILPLKYLETAANKWYRFRNSFGFKEIKSKLEKKGKESTYQYASVRSYLEKKGIPIGEKDLQIASIALANNFDVVTHNIEEFQRIPQLTVHDCKE